MKPTSVSTDRGGIARFSQPELPKDLTHPFNTLPDAAGGLLMRPG